MSASNNSPVSLRIECLETVQGEIKSLDDYKGKSIVVLEFWATWCPPCRSSIPHINDVYKQYKHRNVEVIGITNENSSSIQGFIQQMGSNMTYTVACDKAGLTNGLMQQYQVRGIPHAFILNQNTEVVWHGHPGSNEFESQLAKAVAEFETEKRNRVKSLTREDLENMTSKELKALMFDNGMSTTGCVEKSDLVTKIINTLTERN